MQCSQIIPKPHTHINPPQAMENMSSMKLVPSTEMVGDH